MLYMSIEPSLEQANNPLNTSIHLKPGSHELPSATPLPASTTIAESVQTTGPIQSTTAMGKGISLPILTLTSAEKAQLRTTTAAQSGNSAEPSAGDGLGQLTTPDNRSFLQRAVHFLIPSNLALAMHTGALGTGGILIWRQIETAMCWRCYVHRVLPTIAIVVGSYFSGVIGSKVIAPAKNFIMGSLFGRGSTEAENQPKVEQPSATENEAREKRP